MLEFRIGTDDFKELIDEGGYFVDKSLLIRVIIEGSKATMLPSALSVWQDPEHDHAPVFL